MKRFLISLSIILSFSVAYSQDTSYRSVVNAAIDARVSTSVLTVRDVNFILHLMANSMPSGLYRVSDSICVYMNGIKYCSLDSAGGGGGGTITLTGPITGSGTSTIATTVTAGSITNAMLAGSIAFSKLLGSDITGVGTLTLGTWNATIIGATFGGTGINNGASTITIAGSLVTSGAFTTTITVTAATGVTLPISGTLYGTKSGSITSAQLLTSLTDATGTGTVVYSISPTLTGTPLVPTAAALTNTTQAASTAYVQANMGEVFLTSGSVSNAATMNINYAAYYNLYRKIHIEFYNLLPATTNTNIEIRLAPDGTTFNTGANYMYNYVFNITATLAASGANFIQIANGISNVSTTMVSGFMDIYNSNQSTSYGTIQGTLQGVVSGAAQGYPIVFTGALQVAELTKGVQFLMSAGNITGNWAIYGSN